MCSHCGGRENTLPMLDFGAQSLGFPGISAGVDIATMRIYPVRLMQVCDGGNSSI
jgi:hypothetical protein